MKTLEDRVALVTGSSRGIGQAIAAEFERQGAPVAVHRRNKDALASVGTAIRPDGGNAIGVAGQVASLAANAAIALMTQDVAAQAGPNGIRVNCIAPETILTARNREQIPPARQTAMAEFHPLRRLGTPEDVASAAVFLASDDAAWITG